MLCDACSEREASVHFQQTRHGKTVEHHLCEYCAQKQGMTQQMQDYFGTLWGSAIPSVFNTAGGIPEFGHAATKDIVCPKCQQTYQEFRKTGLFGCSQCYEAFADRLEPVFRRVQGHDHHHGRKMRTADKHASEKEHRLRHLKEQLRHVVEAEDYEQAARLRDEIRSLQQGTEGKEESG